MVRRRAGRLLFTVSLALFGCSFPLLSQGDGTLDPAFGTGGKIALDPLLYADVTATVVAPDGHLVVVGNRIDEASEATGYWAVLDDAGMGTPCVADSPEGGAYFSPRAAGFDPTGRLVVAGDADVDTVGNQGFALRYLYPACVLDTGFNINGIFRTNITGGIGVVLSAIGFGPGSRVILAGTYYEFALGGRPLVVALSGGGLFDFSFGNFGTVDLDLGGIGASTSSVAVQADGRVVLGGQIEPGDSTNQFFLVRLDVAGALDDTFGGDGLVQISVPINMDERLNDLVIDPVSGDILAAGGSGGSLLYPTKLKVVRLRANGALNDDFDDDGIWTAQAPDGGTATAIALQSDGKILVGGTKDHPTTSGRDFVVHRLESDGAADPSFGNLGITEVSFDLDPLADDFLLASTLHAGKLVAAGYARDPAHPLAGRAVVARLWSALIFSDGFERTTAAAWSSTVP